MSNQDEWDFSPRGKLYLMVYGGIKAAENILGGAHDSRNTKRILAAYYGAEKMLKKLKPLVEQLREMRRQELGKDIMASEPDANDEQPAARPANWNSME